MFESSIYKKYYKVWKKYYNEEEKIQIYGK